MGRHLYLIVFPCNIEMGYPACCKTFHSSTDTFIRASVTVDKRSQVLSHSAGND